MTQLILLFFSVSYYQIDINLYEKLTSYIPCQMSKNRINGNSHNLCVDLSEFFNTVTEGNNLGGTDKGTEIEKQYS